MAATDKFSVWIIDRLRRWLIGPQTVAFLPAVVLGAYWFGGEALLLVVSLSAPVIILLLMTRPPDAMTRPRLPKMIDKKDLRSRADDILSETRRSAQVAACFQIFIDGAEAVRAEQKSVADRIEDILLERVAHAIRDGDLACWTTEGTLVVLTRPHPRLTLDAALGLAQRLQRGIEEPVTVDGGSYAMNACIGVAMSTRLVADADGSGFLAAAERALEQARMTGPSAIRAQTGPAPRRVAKPPVEDLRKQALEALGTGQIVPWFQPQLSTETGAVTGVEALSRWIHPDRGTIPPAVFLPVLESAKALSQLGALNLERSAAALKSWEDHGLFIPRVGLNMSAEELEDPHLPERLSWILDAQDMTANRFGIEILETVALGDPEGQVARNIRILGKMGFAIELDDFGTGHSAIAALQRYPVQRIKIDRSFVTRIDKDENQRRIVTGIIGLAERLGLETLAEGVESHGENAVLAQLGCTHVQGFRIARPMPPEMLLGWALEHQQRLATLPRLKRQEG